LLVDRGDAVKAGDELVELHHRDARGLDAATALCGDAFVIADEGPSTYDRIIGEVR
jgi:thymidine phosphorylase